MKVLVTGSEGFIGRNLIVHLSEIKDVEVITYDKDDSFDKIISSIDKISFIYHLAGVNRPLNSEEFYTGNRDLTQQIIELLNEKKKTIPLVLSSSIQAEQDNDYGKSKREAEEYIRVNYNDAYIYRFHNVFGKWCRPNYNSVVATFCHNIANGIDITINDPNAKVELVYIDDICRELVSLLDGKEPSDCSQEICYINPRKVITLQELADMLYFFKDCMKSIYVPNTGNDFVKKLFATYVSYVPVQEMISETKMNVDERGSFTELVRTLDSGQFSISTSKPGIIRGNHYHNTKMERFIVVKGTARITFSHVVTGQIYTFDVDDTSIRPIMIPPGYSHNIENIGNDEMILILWCNELFDEEYPDTYFKGIG